MQDPRSSQERLEVGSGGGGHSEHVEKRGHEEETSGQFGGGGTAVRMSDSQDPRHGDGSTGSLTGQGEEREPSWPDLLEHSLLTQGKRQMSGHCKASLMGSLPCSPGSRRSSLVLRETPLKRSRWEVPGTPPVCGEPLAAWHGVGNRQSHLSTEAPLGHRGWTEPACLLSGGL